MKLYHWLFQYDRNSYSFMVVADSEISAREHIRADMTAWIAQNAAMFSFFLSHIDRPPYFVADPGHVVVVGL